MFVAVATTRVAASFPLQGNENGFSSFGAGTRSKVYFFPFDSVDSPLLDVYGMS
jgi:hypothetical protein